MSLLVSSRQAALAGARCEGPSNAAAALKRGGVGAAGFLVGSKPTPRHVLQQGRLCIDEQRTRHLQALLIRTRCEAAAAEAPASFSASGSGALNGDTLRALWDSVQKPLLKVGRSGASLSQGNSLRQLVASHTLVKVQVNGARGAADVEAAAAALSETAAGCELLQAKGSTLLFGPADASKSALVEAAAGSAALAEAKRQRRTNNRQDPKLALDPRVAAALQGLADRGVFLPGDIDRRAIRAVAAAPPEAALELLASLNKTALRGVKNRAAWLTSRCNRLAEEAGGDANIDGGDGGSE